MFVEEIRRQAEAAPRAALPAVASAMWKAFGEGHLSEAEAEALSALIEARQVSAPRRGENAGSVGISNVGNSHIYGRPDPAASLSENLISPSDRQRSPRMGSGSRPRTDASMERRRRWAASGRLPPALAARFTLAEQAALALVAAETARRGDCRLAIEHLATVAGVSRSTVKAAIREARKLGLLTVEERRLTGFRNDTNVLRIVSPEWTAWLRLARKGVTDREPLGGGVTNRDPITSKGAVKRHPLQSGGGVKFATATPTRVSKQGKTRPGEASQRRIAQAGTPS